MRNDSPFFGDGEGMIEREEEAKSIREWGRLRSHQTVFCFDAMRACMGPYIRDVHIREGSCWVVPMLFWMISSMYRQG